LTNFSFIPSRWSALAEAPQEAERNVHAAPLYAAMLCRRSLEEWVRWMYEHDEDLELPYETSLSALLHNPEFKRVIAPSFFDQLNLIRKIGNVAVHSGKKVSSSEAIHALHLLHSFIRYVCNLYSDTRIPTQPFDEGLLAPSGRQADKNKNELQALEVAFHKQLDELKQAREKLAQAEALLQRQAAHAVPPPVDPNEETTRELYINLLLREAGWDPFGARVAEYPVTGCMPQHEGRMGDGRIDYVLWGDDGKPLAVVEAKRTRRDPRIGQHQAKCYADCIEKQFSRRPIIFYSNGFDTFLWDDHFYAPRPVHGFYTKDELEVLIRRRDVRQALAHQTVNDAITNRYYQKEAIREVAEAIEKGERSALLVMATGTGKTRTAASLVDFLSKAGWVKRVLFLADRNALIYQAKQSFNDVLPQMPAIDLTREKEDDSSRIVFSTYHTMINLIDGEFIGDRRMYGVGHFDLVIFDEIHRSVYNRYRAIFDYFDGIRVGLTATPRDQADRDTYGLFELQPGNPTYAYELEQAVSDGFLVPPRAVSVPLKFQREGIKYAELSEAERLEYEGTFADPVTGEFPDEIDGSALNAWLFNTDTVDKVIGHLMTFGLKVEGGDRLAKTIVFARSHRHAKFIEERFNKQYPEYKGDFLKVIDHHEAYKHDLLNSFKIKDRMPQIAVSVDMLDTGIDVPEVCNLVFFKPVRSAVKFWQMIGRGTRLCKDLFGPGMDKTDFYIFDFCENFEFFSTQPKGLEATAGRSLSYRLFRLRLMLSVALADHPSSDLKAYSSALLAHLISQTQALDSAKFMVRQHWAQVEKYRDPHAWLAMGELDIREILVHIAPLVIETGEHETAKWFDVLMYQLQSDTLIGLNTESQSVKKVQTIAGKLMKKGSIPAVARRMGSIEQLRDTTFWKTADLLAFERMREELRDIIRFIDKEDAPLYYTTFTDEVTSAPKEHVLVYTINELEAYRNRVEQYLRQNKHHMTIHKLRMNEPITKAEIDALEAMLFSQGELGTKEEFVKAYGDRPLGRFIREIVGLDITAAKSLFSEFLTSGNLNAKQIRFIDTLINYLSHKGIIDPAMLFESPFTDIDNTGVLGVFDDASSARIVELVREANGRCEVG
jgi:type I restriction enzyme R subunit